jgi:hypothetical protein
MIILDHEQGSPEWFAARRGIPTASEFDRIITPKTGKASAGQSAYIGELIDQLVNPNAYNEWLGNEHTERGNRLEPKARAYYEFTRRVKTQQCGLVLRDDRLAGCSPDSLIGDDGGVEAKAPEGKKHVKWLVDDELPDEHKAQVHGNLLITGRAFWDFISYCPGYKPFIVRTTPNNYTKDLARELDLFLKKLTAAKLQFIDYIGAAS